MTIKHQIIEKLQEFQRVFQCEIHDMNPQMRERIVIQMGCEAEDQAMRENDQTCFVFEMQTRKLKAMGFPVEVVFNLGASVRVGVFV